MTTAAEILNKGAAHLQDRATTYDKPAGERSMTATVAAFKAVAGITLTEEQGWLFMVLLKAVRSQQGGHRADNYEDGAAYFALAGETAAIERMTPQEVSAKLQEIVAARPVRAEELRADDGWIEWGGGECPVYEDATVTVELMSGQRISAPASDFMWRLKGAPGSIVAYRLAKEQA